MRSCASLRISAAIAMTIASSLFAQIDARAEVHMLADPAASSACIDSGYLESIPQPMGFSTGSHTQSVLTGIFADPMGPGVTGTPGRPIHQYFDHDNSGGFLDYRCGAASYNGHRGTDILIRDFYEMDEGVPALCARAGVVTFVQDGAFDRNTTAPPMNVNHLRVSHDDGTWEWYLHFRKNTIRVHVNDSVHVGDTLALVGSSGQSTWPHLHFQSNGEVDLTFPVPRDPFSGACQSDPSLWITQPAYAIDLPMEVLGTGLTTLFPSQATILERPPMATHVIDNPSHGHYYSWIVVSGRSADDTLSWDIYDNNGQLWFSDTWQDFTSEFAKGIIIDDRQLPTGASFYGTWHIDIRRNHTLLSSSQFLYDAVPNSLPVVAPRVYDLNAGDTLNDEFSAVDADGNIFWYNVLVQPTHGTFEQTGGRARKFRYIPNPLFIGTDSLLVYASDDGLQSGGESKYTFRIGCTAVDSDHDGIGDLCDPCVDPDGDGWGSPGYPSATCASDNCPNVANVQQDDQDFDGIGDACDNCPEVENPLQEDANHNGIGDACDCACNCHGDPVCDGVKDNVQDVVVVINVAFRGATAPVDPNSSCPKEPTDVNCDSFTSVVDVVKVVNVAFRAANPATEFCNPCP